MGGQTAGRAWTCWMEGQVGSLSNDIQSIPIVIFIFTINIEESFVAIINDLDIDSTLKEMGCAEIVW